MPKSCQASPTAKMDKRVAIQSRSRASDGQGGYTETWATDATVWASIEPVKAWEKFQAAQLQTPVTHKVTIRYFPGLTTANRLLYDSREFDIKEVLNVGEKNAFHQLRCLELA